MAISMSKTCDSSTSNNIHKIQECVSHVSIFRVGSLRLAYRDSLGSAPPVGKHSRIRELTRLAKCPHSTTDWCKVGNTVLAAYVHCFQSIPKHVGPSVSADTPGTPLSIERKVRLRRKPRWLASNAPSSPCRSLLIHAPGLKP